MVAILPPLKYPLILPVWLQIPDRLSMGVMTVPVVFHWMYYLKIPFTTQNYMSGASVTVSPDTTTAAFQVMHTYTSIGIYTVQADCH